jgi:hypothetical protein
VKERGERKKKVEMEELDRGRGVGGRGREGRWKFSEKGRNDDISPLPHPPKYIHPSKLVYLT